MEKDLKSKENQLSSDIAALTKKNKFLDKQFSDANAQLRDIVCILAALLLNHVELTAALPFQFHHSERS
jgi:hypothetical protein